MPGILKNKAIVITGSESLELKKHAELFPGRRGEGKKIEVLPLLFPDYIKIKLKKERLPSTVLEREFKNYLLTGGFPKSINSGKKFLKDLLSGFESESVKTGMDMETCYQIIHSLIKKMPSALSYQSIGNDIGVSYKTVEHYIKTIKYLYFLNIAYWKHNDQISFRKEKKIFFRDPFIYHAFSFWTGEKFLESALYEGVVQEHLFRKFGEIFYYRNRYEIDCLAGNFKIEVKAGKPHRRYPKNVKILDEEDLPGFLMGLGRE